MKNKKDKNFLTQITIDDVIDEIRRELKVRERVYPDWIASGRIKQGCAEFRKNCLIANLQLLEEIARDRSAQKKLF